MAQEKDTTKLAEMLQDFIGSENPMLQMMAYMCQQMMEAEVTQKLNAEKSERTDKRSGYRSGYRKTKFNTRLGELDLNIPKVREGGYVPFFKVRRQRSEEALISVIQEIYIHGVSTRKIEHLVEQLGLGTISAAEVSEMTKQLDKQVEAFRHRRLDGSQYPIIWVDALYEKVRMDGSIVSVAVEVVCGVNLEGHREILAIEPMAEESADSYKALFSQLKERGMKTPRLVISDAHSGLTAAIREGLPGASWQRCKVHFMRNILGKVPQKSKEKVAGDVKRIWLEADADEARKTAKAVIDKYEKRFPEAMLCLEEGLEDSLSFYVFPEIDSRKIASSNMIERLNEEIRRRTRVVGIFPNTASYVRLVTVNMMEYSDDWGSGHVYISPATLQTMLQRKGADEESRLHVAG